VTRPLRIQHPGLWHHVVHRGVARQDVFLGDADREEFLALLGDCGERWALRTHAYALMPNHYHLLVLDEAGRLSRAMRHLNGVYTQRFNRRHGRDGPLLRGRYGSRVVQDGRYLLEVVRYVHLNPVRAGLAATAGEHMWSSHRWYLAGGGPECLVCDEILGRFAGDRSEARAGLDAFVHEVEPEGRPAPAGAGGAVFGDQAFVDGWRRSLRGRGRGGEDDREVPEARRLAGARLDDVLDAVCTRFSVEVAELRTGRRGTTNTPRRLALVLAADHTPATHRELAEAFRLRPSSVSSLVARYRRVLQKEPESAQALQAVAAGLRP